MLYAENVTKSFGPVDVIRDLSFIVGDGEHAGLVGPNGGGKSTILRLLAGEHRPDTGAAGYRGTSLGYLRQEAGLEDGNTLLEELWLAFPEARSLELELEDIAAKIERGDGDLDALIERQAQLFFTGNCLDAPEGVGMGERVGWRALGRRQASSHFLLHRRQIGQLSRRDVPPAAGMADRADLLGAFGGAGHYSTSFIARTVEG